MNPIDLSRFRPADRAAAGDLASQLRETVRWRRGGDHHTGDGDLGLQTPGEATVAPGRNSFPSSIPLMAQELPPGPTGPRALIAAKWIFRSTEMMAEAQAEYGDVWTLRLVGHHDNLCITDPALIQEVFKADPEVMHGGEANITATAVLGTHSVLVLDGPEHTVQRKLLRAPFQGDRMERYRELMASICEEEIETWPVNEPFELLPRMEAITLKMIMSVIFGVQGGPSQSVLHERIDALLKWGASKFVMPRMRMTVARGKPAPKSFLKVRDPLDAAIFEELERARRDPNLAERDDVLAMLLRTHHDDGSPMTDRELRDALMTLLLQGHSSTATALSWALERLMRHPDVFERLRAELQTGSEDYLDAVVTETLRLRPPVPMVSRHVMQPFRLGPYDLEPGTIVAILIYQVHRRPELYPEPERFRPERFLEQPPSGAAFIPFGGGDRHCIGRTFATTELNAVLRTITQRTRLAPATLADEKLERRRVLFIPSDGARAVLTERTALVGASA
jgi:cytochrome P450